VAIYQVALAQVYGYLLVRCGSVSIAEDLTAETFLAAVTARTKPNPPTITVAWLIGVARHKLVDHWRRLEREQRTFAAVHEAEVEDPLEARLDAATALAQLAKLPGPQRAALTLRYLDGLPVAEVARHLGRTVHGTETLLVRARAALRRVYEDQEQP
jgi:RNA polymerase sigma-70 factor, ECF subfamily